MVAPSDFYTARSLDFLERPCREFLARRGQMAWTNIALANSRWVLCNFLSGNASSRSRWIAKEQRPLHVSTASNRHCRIELHPICWIHGVAFNPVRLWRLHHPSRGHPYFTSGRLLGGALIPFAFAYVYGISYLFRRANPAVSLAILGLILTFGTSSEIIINRVVFASEHNWFHR